MSKLTDITREMINVSRFGAKVERLTRKTRGKEVPYGPHQVRFCDGARVRYSKKDEKTCSVVWKTRTALRELCQRRVRFLKGKIDSILMSALNGSEVWEAQSATTIEEIDRLAEWIDELSEPDQEVPQQGDEFIYGLNPAWCYYVETEEEVQAAKVEIRSCMVPLRRLLLTELKNKLKWLLLDT